MRADAPFHKAVREFKRKLVQSALEATQGNRTQAARLLGLQRTYLYRLLRELGDSTDGNSGPPRRPGSGRSDRPLNQRSQRGLKVPSNTP